MLSFTFNLLLLSTFTIYFNILPIGVETQPLLPMFFAFCFIILRKKSQLIDEETLLIHLFLIMLTFHLYITILLNIEIKLVDYLKYLIGPFIFYATYSHFHLIKYKYVKFITITFFILCGIHFFNIEPLSSSILNLLKKLIPRYFIGIGTRSFSILAPEPSYTGIFLIFILFLLDYSILLDEKKGYDKKSFIIYKVMVLIMILITKSSLAYLLTIIYYVPVLINKRRIIKVLRLSPFAVIFSIITLNFFCQTRLFEVTKNILNTYIKTSNLLTALAIGDPSTGTRFILNSIGYLSVMSSPIGYGIGTFGKNWYILGEKFGFPILKNEVLLFFINSGRYVYSQSYMANLFHDVGIISIIIVGLIFMRCFIKLRFDAEVLRKSLYFVIVALFFLQSQITNPIPWLLVAMVHSINRNKKFRKRITIESN